MRVRLAGRHGGTAAVEHRLLVVAGGRLTGFAVVAVDGKNVSVGSIASPADGVSIERTSTHELSVSTAQFSFLLSNSDRFINQAVRSNVPIAQLTSHGLLGQTHRRATVVHGGGGVRSVVEGEVDDYVVTEDNVFGIGCVYNQYEKSE